MTNPRITVLMSVYNGEKYLREAIDSILNQTFKDLEFLIINDGSTDKTAEILQSYQDPRIKIINNQKNIGLTKSLNKGLKLAKGEYIARMDADDISYQDRLQVQYDYLKNNPEVDLVGSWNDVIDDIGNTISFWKCNYSSEDIYYILNFRNCLTHCSLLFRKELVVNNGGYNETMKNAQDYELWSRISKIAKIYQIQEPLVKWRMNSNVISTKKKNNQVKTINTIVKNNLERLTDRKVDDKILCFIRDNFDNINCDCLDTLTKDELLYSIQLIDEMNEKIIDNAPYGLNRESIRKISARKLSNYIYLATLKVGILSSVQYITKCIKGSILVKIKIIILIIYRYLTHSIRKL